VLAVADDQCAFAIALGIDQLEAPASWINGDERDRAVSVFA